MNIIVVEDLDFGLNHLDANGSAVPNLLSMIDGLLSYDNYVLFVTATNISDIPDEFKRSGRFDYIKHIQPPTPSIVEEYFKWFYSVDIETTSDDNLNTLTVSKLAKEFARIVPDGMHICEIQKHLRRFRLNPKKAVWTLIESTE